MESNSSAPEGLQNGSQPPSAPVVVGAAATRLAGRVDSAEGRAEADRNMAEASGTNRQVYTSQQIKNQAFNVFEELRRERQLCDVVIHIGSSEFSAHRVILAAASPYFRSMFTGRCRQADGSPAGYFQTLSIWPLMLDLTTSCYLLTLSISNFLLPLSLSRRGALRVSSGRYHSQRGGRTSNGTSHQICLRRHH